MVPAAHTTGTAIQSPTSSMWEGQATHQVVLHLGGRWLQISRRGQAPVCSLVKPPRPNLTRQVLTIQGVVLPTRHPAQCSNFVSHLSIPCAHFKTADAPVASFNSGRNAVKTSAGVKASRLQLKVKAGAICTSGGMGHANCRGGGRGGVMKWYSCRDAIPSEHAAGELSGSIHSQTLSTWQEIPHSCSQRGSRRRRNWRGDGSRWGTWD